MWHHVLADPLAVRLRWKPRLCSGLIYDFRVKPDRHTVTTPTPMYTDIDLFEPATEEGARHLRILIRPLPHIEFLVDVKHHYYVSVGQLLHMIYQKLHEPVSRSDLYKLSRHDYRLVMEQFKKRARSSRDRDYQLCRGPRGIDLFLGNTKFYGLQPSWRGKDVFELVMKEPH
ncbi:hypothetical protein A7U60_g6931 [Sanghuangporus baumii]|uniref:DUF6699 domain-containing protein n=1 Tax=Sanghuangporus baumii TaxID=108892 RepID=A0A9Q5HU44_SANBA|nr:hypothetical protein A7U60_g6931 [Sanghuangporus baumii]